MHAGYFFVVQILRFFLAPIYEIMEIKQAGSQEILVKWSWTMNFWWNRYLPTKFFWDPRLVFTGATVLGYNPDTGESICSGLVQPGCTSQVLSMQED